MNLGQPFSQSVQIAFKPVFFYTNYFFGSADVASQTAMISNYSTKLSILCTNITCHLLILGKYKAKIKAGFLMQLDGKNPS